MVLGDCLKELGLKGGTQRPSPALDADFGEVADAFNERLVVLSREELKQELES